MAGARRTYAKEFKKEAVELLKKQVVNPLLLWPRT
ncbi:hypothetical protein JOC37_002199 [Desulfohalotomaculum tongense]|nr:hypothetical protein [Desulforadius tongensis]